jgi:Tol biopolymer transport system component
MAGWWCRPAVAACNLIPGTEQVFDSTLGATNRPYAAPSEPIEVRRRPCDAGTALSAAATDHLVTVIYASATGPKNAVVLTAAADCTAVTPLLAACETQLGAGGVATCISGASAGMQIIDRNLVRYMRFSFPDTDDRVGTASDDQTLSGSAKIAVVPSTAAALPCQLATQTCAGQSGLNVCIDDFFTGDGTCGRGVGHGTFNHFTALPPPNDFQAACFAEDPPCDVFSFPDVRLTADADGNVLLPMDWRGVLLRQNNVPVPRLLRAILAPAVPVQIPGRSFVASYTPEGGLLPPIFEPQFNPQAPGGVATLFGSVDAPYTVLRVARRSAVFQQCSGGFNDGGPCNVALDCPAECTSGPDTGKRCTSDADCSMGACGSAGSCGQTFCVGGSRNLLLCNGDGMCPGGECGPALFNVASLGSGGGIGPITIARLGAGVCQVDPNTTCTTDAQCSSPPCVKYALSTQLAVPLEGLTQTQNVFAFTVNEAVEAHDRNGDSDMTDSVMALRDRETGNTLSIGPGGAQSRAVVRTRELPFTFPAVATEGDVVAFLEPEALQGATVAAQDKNGDGDTFDTILRVYRRDDGATATEVTASLSPPVAADAALLINGRSLAVSNGQVFFRASESAAATHTTIRVSVPSGGSGEANGYSAYPTMSDDGREVAFHTQATNLDPFSVDDVNNCDTGGAGSSGSFNCLDVYLHDRQTVSTERISLGPLGEQNNSYCFRPTISADGQKVVFEAGYSNWFPPSTFETFVTVRDRSGPTTTARTIGAAPFTISSDVQQVGFFHYVSLLPIDNNGATYDVYVHDSGTSLNTLESITADGMGSGAGNSSVPSLSRDGRFIAFFSEATDLVSPPTLAPYLHLRDRLAGSTRAIALNGVPGAFSGDSHYLAFYTNYPGLIPADTNGAISDIFIYDRFKDSIELVSVASTGAVTDGDSFSPSLSSDGRYVAFVSSATNLVPGDTNGADDVFVHDRLTGLTTRVSAAADGTEGDGSSGGSGPAPITADGRQVAFASAATNLVGMGADLNTVSDIFVRHDDPAAIVANDLTGDADLDDTVLEVLNAGTMAPPTKLCPAGSVEVAGGAAAFLRPESAGFTTSLSHCPPGAPVAGKPDLNDDGDTTDDVVHFWSGSGDADNLHRAATKVALSATCSSGTHVGQGCRSDADCDGTPCSAVWLSALVSESAQDTTDFNNDNDNADTVLQVHTLSDPPTLWRNIGQAADGLEAVGNVIAITTLEAAQNNDLNGDNDQSDRVLQIYDAASRRLTNTGQAVEEFVMGSAAGGCGSSPVVAFRTSEAAQGDGSLNGDGDSDDFVLQVYAKGLGVVNTHQAVTACTIAACDPRFPYRVFGSQVKFLTSEADQGHDLNGDNDATDLVLQVYDVCARTTTVVSSIDDTTPGAGDVTDPTAQDPQSEGHAVITTGKRCVQGLTTLLVPATCATDADCPAGATCTAELISAAPGAVPHHDTALLPAKPITVTLRSGTIEVLKTIALKVRNADVLPVKERSGHQVRLSVGAGDCPALMVEGLPDFNSKMAGDQDVVTLTGGKTKTAKVRLRIKRDDFATHNSLAPARCTLNVSASTALAGNQDPTPRNNLQTLELNVIDKNDAPSVGTHESLIKSINPIKLTIKKTATSVTKTIGVKLTNADINPPELSGHPIVLSIDQGDCPVGTVAVVPPATLTPAGGATVTAKLTVSATNAGFTATNAKALGRCTAVLTATTSVMGNVEPNQSNNSAHLLIEVNDKNDY